MNDQSATVVEVCEPDERRPNHPYELNIDKPFTGKWGTVTGGWFAAIELEPINE